MNTFLKLELVVFLVIPFCSCNAQQYRRAGRIHYRKAQLRRSPKELDVDFYVFPSMGSPNFSNHALDDWVVRQGGDVSPSYTRFYPVNFIARNRNFIEGMSVFGFMTPNGSGSLHSVFVESTFGRSIYRNKWLLTSINSHVDFSHYSLHGFTPPGITPVPGGQVMASAIGAGISFMTIINMPTTKKNRNLFLSAEWGVTATSTIGRWNYGQNKRYSDYLQVRVQGVPNLDPYYSYFKLSVGVRFRTR